ncbi:MAG: hypothetical protein VXX63_05885 [Bacteroidota bacterium]|nr:hypothetical protein [Bacteroidota bacterium]
MIWGFCCLNAQTNERSPYSAFGFGDNFHSPFINYQAMGGVGNATKFENSFTLQNPASYSGLKFTCLQMGAFADFGFYQNSEEKAKFSTAQFSYFALGMPVYEKRNGSLVFAASPSNTMGYQMQTLDTQTYNSSTTYQGEGGLAKITIGTSLEPIKNLALGVNFNYLFGNISKSRELAYPFRTDLFGYTRSENVNYSGWQSHLGFHYTLKKGKLYHRLGFTFLPSTTLRGTGELLTKNNRYSYQTGNAQTLDTIGLETIQNRKEKLPSIVGFGYALGNGEKWSLSLDYSVSNWGNISHRYKNEQRLAIGFFLIPKRKPGLGISYFERIRYSGGFHKTHSFIFLNETQIESFGTHFGLGFPMMKRIKRYAKEDLTIISRLHLSLSYNRRGTTMNNLIQENFFQLGIGLNLGDKWFIKRKYQ